MIIAMSLAMKTRGFIFVRHTVMVAEATGLQLGSLACN